MTKKSWQKFKYLKNEKSFKDEIKSIFHQFQRACTEVNKTIFLEGGSLTLSNLTIAAHNKRVPGGCLHLKPSSTTTLVYRVKPV